MGIRGARRWGLASRQPGALMCVAPDHHPGVATPPPADEERERKARMIRLAGAVVITAILVSSASTIAFGATSSNNGSQGGCSYSGYSSLRRQRTVR